MSNTNLVTNLNADLLDGKEGNYYTEYTDTAISNIQVGGRNLVLNSDTRLETNDYFIGLVDLSRDLQDGEQLTITAWGELASNQLLYVGLSPSTFDLIMLPKHSNGSYTGTFTFKKSAVYPNDVRNKLILYNYTQGGDLTGYIDKIKLEKGNKATDWTPAPEDVKAQIALKLDKLIFDDLFEKVNLGGGIYAIKAKYDFYSIGEISAYGLGSGSTGGATVLDDLTDVTIVNPLNNQFLVYNFSTKQWENQTISFTPTSHSHSISDITGLQNNLTSLYDHTTNTTVHLTQEDRDYLNNLKTWWRFNTESQKLWTPYDVYSEGEVSAYGAGGEGTPTDGVLYMKDLLDVQFAMTIPTNDTIKFNGTKWVNVPFPTGVSSWNDLTDKPLTFTPTAHNHSANEIISGILTIGRIPTGTTETTVALGNHVHSWNAITNKPSVFTPDTHDHYVADILNFPASLPASDVSAWAKAATKPSYNFSEIGSKPTNLSGYGITDALGINSNAVSASKLQTARTIWGQSFNGTANVSGAFSGATTGVFSSTVQATTAILTNLTANYLPKHTATGLVNSSIFDNGNVGIDTTSPKAKLTVVGGYSSVGNSIPSGWGIISSGRIGVVNGNQAFYFDNTDTNYAEFSTYDYGSGGTKSMVFQANGGNVGIYTTSPAYKLDVNGTGRFVSDLTAQTDILTPFKTWSNATDRNSLKKFLDLFDIDTAGNLVVTTNLYSTGEVTAYSSGTGVSGLKLMGNLDANNKNINNVLNINAQQINTSKVSINVLQIGNNPTGDFPNCVGLFGYRDDEVATYLNIIATYKENTGEYIYANNLFVVDSAGQASATSFKFGNYSFKQSANGLSICFNGVEQAYITNTGQYVNS